METLACCGAIRKTVKIIACYGFGGSLVQPIIFGGNHLPMSDTLYSAGGQNYVSVFEIFFELSDVSNYVVRSTKRLEITLADRCRADNGAAL